MKKLDKIIGLLYFLIAVAAILCVIYKYHSIFKHYSFNADPSKWGQIGDYFGGLLNPIISFTTLIFLIKAYYSQRQELEDTKIALRETAEYNRKQTSLMDISIKISQLNAHIDISHKEMGYIQDEINRAEACKYKQSNGFGHYFYTRDGNRLDGSKLNDYISQLIKELQKETSELKKTMDKIRSLSGE